MRLGLLFDLRNPPAWRRPWQDLYARSIEQIVEAEALGIDIVWFTEHHLFDDGYLPQPFTFAAAVAARTHRVRVGTAIALAPLRDSIHTAEEAAVVDLISNGRFELGLGAGYRIPEFEAFGADITRRFGRTDAVASEVRRLWREGSVSPQPAQERVPIWMGYQAEQSARRAGLLGEGLLFLSRDLVAPYREGFDEGGHDPALAKMAGLINVVVADDPEAVWTAVLPHLAWQVNSYRRSAAEGNGQPVPRLLSPETLREAASRGKGGGMVPPLEVLTVDQAVDRVVAEIDGVPMADEIHCFASIGAMHDELVSRHVELWCTAVREGVLAKLDSTVAEV